MMKYVIWILIFVVLFIFAKGITKEECEEKSGKFCPEAGECYWPMSELVATYEEAEALCKEKGAIIPSFHLDDYSNFMKCVNPSWDFPFTLFFQPSLLAHTSDKCISTTFIDKTEFSTMSRCSLQNKARVICEIPL